MRPRTFLIAANWKMTPPPAGFEAPDSPYRPVKEVDVAVFPTALDLRRCADAKLMTGGQTGHPEAKGAHTGDISMAMLKDAGATYVMCGHSERRRSHGETDAMVRAQAEAALKAGLQPIVCVGETADEREEGMQEDVVRRQLEGMPKGIIVAYEPVWAISGGDPSKASATPQDAQAMHAFIRGLLPDGAGTRILYGGSMTAANARDLLEQPDIDGGLVGGASLKPADFRTIVDMALAVQRI